MAFRSVPRPSSPPGAKASTECPYRARKTLKPEFHPKINPDVRRHHAQEPSTPKNPVPTPHARNALSAIHLWRPAAITDGKATTTPLNANAADRLTKAARRLLRVGQTSRSPGQRFRTNPDSKTPHRSTRQSIPQTARPETHQNLIHTDKDHHHPHRQCSRPAARHPSPRR